MKNKLYYAPEAKQDLDDIWNYIMLDLCNSDAAMDTVTHIMDTIDRLQDFSEIGTPLLAVTGIESDYRFLVCKNYLVFYRTYAKDVYIDRILYSMRDYLRILFGTSEEAK